MWISKNHAQMLILVDMYTIKQVHSFPLALHCRGPLICTCHIFHVIHYVENVFDFLMWISKNHARTLILVDFKGSYLRTLLWCRCICTLKYYHAIVQHACCLSFEEGTEPLSSLSEHVKHASDMAQLPEQEVSHKQRAAAAANSF